MKEYIFTKDYKLIGEENLEIEIEEQDSLIKVEFEELETAPQEYVVSVSSNGNGVATATPHVATKGTLITLKDMPVIGYKLESYEVLSGGVVIRDNKFILGNSDVSIRANFEMITYTVSFDMQGYGTQIPSEMVGYESTATEPTAPTDTDATFKGWYTEPECINEFNFNTPIVRNITLYADWIPLRGEFIVFSSEEPFSISTTNRSKSWDGILEYSINTKNWAEWNGAEVNSGEDEKLYFRGSNNTIITPTSPNLISSNPWVLNGNAISCSGNIENLLDYQVTANGGHPVMGGGCFMSMFNGCTTLMTAPELPATTLTEQCYNEMFFGCISLTTAPELPAMTLARSCYSTMFLGCTSLVTIHELPATTLVMGCYDSMFYGCTALTTLSTLSATTLTTSCYNNMFRGCSLIKLSKTRTADYTTPYRIPIEGTGIDASYSTNNMFVDTGGTYTGTPTINKTYYLHRDNSIVS